MRLALVSLLVIGSIAVAAGAADTPSPPVIHEPFTPLPCPANPGTTIGILACTERDVVKTDRAIDARARAIFKLLGSRAARTSFVNSERLWLRYRRASCTAEASKYEGGSAQPLLFADCEVRRNRTHLKDLDQIRQTLSVH